jgi:hypothetical protein
MIQKTNVVYTHTTWQKYSRSFVSNDPGECCCAPLLDATTFEIGYPTTEKLVYSAVSKERVRNSCVMCTLHTISQGTTQPCATVSKIHVA